MGHGAPEFLQTSEEGIFGKLKGKRLKTKRENNVKYQTLKCLALTDLAISVNLQNHVNSSIFILGLQMSLL